MKLSIILPARNEESLIVTAVGDIVSFLEKRKIYDYEVLVVINGTTDTTEKIVKDLNARNKRIKVLNSRTGYGPALKMGLRKAKGDYIAIFNVDFYDQKMLDLASIDLYGKDLIIGSKMANWSIDRRPFIRRLISFLFNLYLRVAYGFKGSDTHGIKIMKKRVNDTVLIKCKTESGIFDTEFVLKAQRQGFSIADFPVFVEEKRKPRFTNRLFTTLGDIYRLDRSIRTVKRTNK